MPRLSHLVVPGYPHHITQCGVRSMEIFADDRNRLSYSQFLEENANPLEGHYVEVNATLLAAGSFHMPVLNWHKYKIITDPDS
jgi:hypothetical protein